MRIRKSQKYDEKKNFRLVPKEFIGYLFLVGIVCITTIPCSVCIVVTCIQKWRQFQLNEVPLIIMFPLFISIIGIYFLISAIKLCRGKIYLEVSNENLVFHGILLKEYMNVSDIKTIKKVDGYKQLTAIVILRKTDKHLNGSKKIKFPIIWFVDRDIEYFLVSISKMNKKIEWSGFWFDV